MGAGAESKRKLRFEKGAVSLDKAAEMGRKIASIEPAKKQGGTGANQHTAKDNSRVDNINSAKPRKKGGTDPEYIIARLKRDAATDPNAQALLDTLAAGDISARVPAQQAFQLQRALHLSTTMVRCYQPSTGR